MSDEELDRATAAARLSARATAEEREAWEVRAKVIALLEKLQPWQRKAIIDGLTWYTTWPADVERRLL